MPIEPILPEVNITEQEATYGQFEIEPLERGFGHTLGNALRRVLLSSLPGAAITSIRIIGRDGEIRHEFTDVPGVREDVTQIVLNVKKIRLRSFSEAPVEMILDAHGPGTVTAAQIELPAEVELVTPDQYIATLDSEDARLTIRFTVEQGVGYRPGEHREDQPIGVIPVDAIFTPIRKVEYFVEPARFRDRTDIDRLVLRIWTDGTITPEDALHKAAEILTRQFQALTATGVVPQPVVKQPLTPLPVPPRWAEAPVEELELSNRTLNCLKRNSITRVGQLLEMTEEELLSLRNFGQKSLDELKEALRSRGLLPGAPSGSAPLEAAAVTGQEEE
jgi:DNA-directed RNA polymerase subunit alpha